MSRNNQPQYNLTNNQLSSVPKMEHQLINIPSSNQASFGSSFLININEMSMIHEIILQYNMSSITGLSTLANYPQYVPGYFFFTRIDIFVGSNCIDSIYPLQQFVNSQIFNDDCDRWFISNGCGAYNSASQRATMASTSNSYFIPIRSFFNQSHMSLINNNHNVSLRIFNDTLTNCVIQSSSQTGTAVASIISVNALVRCSRPSMEQNALNINNLNIRPNHYLFNETRYMPVPVSSGLLSCTNILNGITGSVSYLFFTLRYSNALTGLGAFTYLPIASFAILGADGSNICGGGVISSATNLTVMNRYNTLGSYTSETALGTLNNGANVYIFPFCCDIITQSQTGQQFGGGRVFTGNEQLIVNFTSALTSAAQLDVFASVNGIIEQTTLYIKKKTL